MPAIIVAQITNRKDARKQSVGAGTKFLKLGMIKDMEISLPSLSEQEQIVSTVGALREETERLTSNTNKN